MVFGYEVEFNVQLITQNIYIVRVDVLIRKEIMQMSRRFYIISRIKNFLISFQFTF